MTEILYQEPLSHYKKRKNLRFLLQLMGLIFVTIYFMAIIPIFDPVSVLLPLLIVCIIPNLIGFIVVVKYVKRVTLTSEGFVASQIDPWDPEQIPYSEIAYIAWPPNLFNVLHIHMRTRWPRIIQMPVKDLNMVVWILWSKGLKFRWAAWYER
jgi:hypothetical protein